MNYCACIDIYEEFLNIGLLQHQRACAFAILINIVNLLSIEVVCLSSLERSLSGPISLHIHHIFVKLRISEKWYLDGIFSL